MATTGFSDVADSEPAGNCGFSWESRNVRPGRYTVTMKQDTGPLAGIFEGTLEITIE